MGFSFLSEVGAPLRRDYLLKFNEHWFLEVLRGGKLLFQAGHGLALVGICFGSLHIYPYPLFYAVLYAYISTVGGHGFRSIWY